MAKNPLQDVVRYYEQTRFDYRVAWDDSPYPAVHFGYYEPGADRHELALQNTNRVLAELARIRPGERVLDAGCGRGGTALWLAEERRARVVGISPVPAQIEECRQRAGEKGFGEELRFEVGDYRCTGFPDASFDVVLACESLCHAPDKDAFYREAYRLLKPGGRLVLAEYLRRGRPLSLKDERLLHAWLRRWSIPDLDTEEEHRRHAGVAGFEEVHIRDVTDRVRVSLRNLHEKSLLWLPVGALLRVLGIRSRVQHGNQVGGIRQYQALRRGLWFYAHLSMRKPEQP